MTRISGLDTHIYGFASLGHDGAMRVSVAGRRGLKRRTRHGHGRQGGEGGIVFVLE